MDCVICPGSESRQCILFPLSLNHQSSNLKLSSRLMTILMNSLYSLYFLYSPSESPADFCQKKGSYFVPLSSVYSAWSILYCMVDKYRNEPSIELPSLNPLTGRIMLRFIFSGLIFLSKCSLGGAMQHLLQ